MKKFVFVTILLIFFGAVNFAASCVEETDYAYIDTRWTSTGCCNPPLSYWGCPSECGGISSCTCADGCGNCTNCCATSGSGGTLTYYCPGTSCTQACSPNSIDGCETSCCTPQYFNECDTTDGCGETRDTGEYNSCDLDSNVACGEETQCDGIDNDCDGTIDNFYENCNSGRLGICKDGRKLCVDGDFEECIPINSPVDEICDGLDNDCDSFIDEDFQCIKGTEGCTDECKISTTEINTIEHFEGEITGSNEADARIECLYDGQATLQLLTEEGENIDITPTATNCGTSPTEINISLDNNQFYINTPYTLIATLNTIDCSVCTRTIYLEYIDTGNPGDPDNPEVVPNISGENGENVVSSAASIPDNNLILVLMVLFSVSIILLKNEKV